MTTVNYKWQKTDGIQLLNARDELIRLSATKPLHQSCPAWAAAWEYMSPKPKPCQRARLAGLSAPLSLMYLRHRSTTSSMQYLRQHVKASQSANRSLSKSCYARNWHLRYNGFVHCLGPRARNGSKSAACLPRSGGLRRKGQTALGYRRPCWTLYLCTLTGILSVPPSSVQASGLGSFRLGAWICRA